MSNLYLILAIFFGVNVPAQDECNGCPDFSRVVLIDVNSVGLNHLYTVDTTSYYTLKKGATIRWDDKGVTLNIDGEIVDRYRSVDNVEHNGYPYLKTRKRLKTWYIQPTINPITDKVSISIHNDRKGIEYIYTGPYRYE